jgi:hypothetical protein
MPRSDRSRSWPWRSSSQRWCYRNMFRGSSRIAWAPMPSVIRRSVQLPKRPFLEMQGQLVLVELAFEEAHEGLHDSKRKAESH